MHHVPHDHRAIRSENSCDIYRGAVSTVLTTPLNRPAICSHDTPGPPFASLLPEDISPIGARGERASEHMIVIGIAHYARQLGRLDEFDGGDVIGEQIARGFADRAELPNGERTR